MCNSQVNYEKQNYPRKEYSILILQRKANILIMQNFLKSKSKFTK